MESPHSITGPINKYVTLSNEPSVISVITFSSMFDELVYFRINIITDIVRLNRQMYMQILLLPHYVVFDVFNMNAYFSLSVFHTENNVNSHPHKQITKKV